MDIVSCGHWPGVNKASLFLVLLDLVCFYVSVLTLFISIDIVYCCITVYCAKTVFSVLIFYFFIVQQ